MAGMAASHDKSSRSSAEKVQFSTFLLANRLYGIDVTRVQEVVRPLTMTRIPLAQDYVRGLINLRGQVATAIGLRELFELPTEPARESMNVVCKCDGNLISLLVDEIGDVIEVAQDAFEDSLQTIPSSIRRFMHGVYKVDGPLLSIIDVDRVARFLSK
jgi:purine-binding chemotaxis protein CheW